MNRPHFITGLGKVLVYLRIIVSIPCHYAVRPRFFRSPVDYVRFLARALRLLLVFRHNKVVRVYNGWKLHLYLPSYPSPAFYYALESKLLRSPPGPTTIVFSMTKACDYRCEHCYQRRDGGADLDETLLIRTAQAVRDEGVAMFDIEGGEPFLRFDRLLALVRALDPRCEIWINSTGAHVKPGMLEELKAAQVFGVMVSIHSPDPAKHDAFTGIPGSFDTACRLVRAWRALGRAAALNSVLSEEELLSGSRTSRRARDCAPYPDTSRVGTAVPRRPGPDTSPLSQMMPEKIGSGGLDSLMHLARDLGCDYVQLIHPKPAGKWLGRAAGMQTARAVIEHVRREHLRFNSRAMHGYPSLAAQVFEEAEHVLGCTAGAIDRFYVNATGEIQPCEFLNLSFGNVREESFDTIFKRMRSFFPTPGTDWLCCTLSGEIHRLFEEHHLERTPLPWSVTQKLAANISHGRPTPIYQALGIYTDDRSENAKSETRNPQQAGTKAEGAGNARD